MLTEIGPRSQFFTMNFQWSNSMDTKNVSEDENVRPNLNWLPSKEVSISDADDSIPSDNEVDAVNFGLQSVDCLKSSYILSRIRNDGKISQEYGLSLAERNHSDLIPSIYEGGLKIWECTKDLANYITTHELSRKSVLDLGCGVGLLGILALTKNAAPVYFQDYNMEVLQYATIPNVHLNNHEFLSRCRFFSGDWDSFAEKYELSCDLVLTSETIYSPLNYLKFHNTLQKVLKPCGQVLLAAKSYYFGVGGSTRQFEKFVQEKNIFNTEVVWKCSEGVQREILKLTFKSGS